LHLKTIDAHRVKTDYTNFEINFINEV